MKSKFFIILLILVLGIVPLAAGCDRTTDGDNGDTETPQTWTLDFATFWPDADFQVADGHKVWAKEIADRVKAETPHTIKFEFHPAGVLLGATEIYTGVADGAAHIGTTCPLYTMGMFPLTMGIELPGYNNDNALVASVTINEAWKASPELQKEHERVKIMFFWATGPGDFMTNKPVKTMEDLAGMQIRAAGGSAKAIAALGGTPVGLPMSESYVNLQSGNVDGILAPTDTLKGFKLAEVTKYITKTPFVGYNVVFVKVMNWDTWDSFPPSVQKIFDEVNAKYVVEYGKLRTDHTVIGQKYAVDEYGHEVYELDAAERAKWMEKIIAIPQQWVKDTGGAAQKLYDLYKTLDAKYSAEYGSYGK
jgi:TRAP-type transport system periplasmic protein